MTRQRDFKALVRERMAKTGERYTAARTHILAKTIRHAEPATAFPGVLEGYTAFGGQQAGTGAIHNVLQFLGIVSPLGSPPSEAMINGLCGGPGFATPCSVQGVASDADAGAREPFDARRLCGAGPVAARSPAGAA